MKIKAVKNKRVNYPTLENFLQDPNSLKKSIPASWHKNKVLAGAMGMFLLLDCKNDKSPTTQKSGFSYFMNSVKDKLDKLENWHIRNKVAPIFIHGDGSGASGCLVMSSPVFISEKEAKSIILEEFRKEKIEFDTTNCPTVKFKLKKWISTKDNKGKISKMDVEHRLDGYNKTLNIAFDYISIDDYNKLEEASETWSSVSDYSTKERAEFVRKGILKNDQYNAVVFYDPIVQRDFSFFIEDSTKRQQEKEEKSPQEQAKENLIAQVSDFIIWAKKEGLIK
jgi:hypothetical protein